MKVPVDSVKVGDRIREDMGDIDAMAESLRRYGQLQPIVIAAENHALIIGHRRLLGARKIGWAAIEAELRYGTSERERWEMEREENEQRKALSEGERSKTYQASVKLVEQAKETAERLFVSQDTKSRMGRPPIHGVPRQDVAEALGVSEGVLRHAEQHVAAVERYPEVALPGIPQSDAITIARTLDTLPEDEREEKRARIREFHQPTMAELAGKPPMPTLPPTEPNPAARWTAALVKFNAQLIGIRDAGGVRTLVAKWSLVEREAYRDRLAELVDLLAGWQQEIEELIGESKSA